MSSNGLFEKRSLRSHTKYSKCEFLEVVVPKAHSHRVIRIEMAKYSILRMELRKTKNNSRRGDEDPTDICCTCRNGMSSNESYLFSSGVTPRLFPRGHYLVHKADRKDRQGDQ